MPLDGAGRLLGLIACFSLGQSIFNLAITQVTSSSSSSNTKAALPKLQLLVYIQPLRIRCRQHEFLVLVRRIHRASFKIQNGVL